MNIPNALTSGNLICGCIAMVMAQWNFYNEAVAAIMLAAVFDFFDGFAARRLGTSGPIGKELDSLADVVSFGVAPSMCLYAYTVNSRIMAGHEALAFIFFIIAAFSALRLAKFNLDERQTTSFIGLPTPANAIFWASSIAALNGLHLTPGIGGVITLIAMTILSCWLLICELPMFSLKFHDWSWADNKVRYAFLAASLTIIVAGALIGMVYAGLAAVILIYVIANVILRIIRN